MSVDKLPTWSEVARAASHLVTTRDKEWSGLPIPLPGHNLSIAEGHPWRDRMLKLNEAINPPEPADAGIRLINKWWSPRLRVTVAIVEVDGSRRAVPMTSVDYSERINFLLQTLMVAKDAWMLDTELTAVEKLAELLPSHLFEAYVTTGTFIETSKRSGLTYIFRRCKPTVAVRARDTGMRVLCALCLHPVAYYEGSHAGGMCPTDDVIAHLLLMRADEPMFWRRANQHQPDRPEAAI